MADMDTLITERNVKFWVEVQTGFNGHQDIDSPSTFAGKHINDAGPFDTRAQAEAFVANLKKQK